MAGGIKKRIEAEIEDSGIHGLISLIKGRIVDEMAFFEAVGGFVERFGLGEGDAVGIDDIWGVIRPVEFIGIESDPDTFSDELLRDFE